MQEEGYYPFGLEMKAISSQAAMKQQTNYKFNAGTNLESDFNVDYYETSFREYDAQIGRFTGIDAMSERYYSQTTYQYALNNPLYFNDPSGALSNLPKYIGGENYQFSDGSIVGWDYVFSLLKSDDDLITL